VAGGELLQATFSPKLQLVNLQLVERQLVKFKLRKLAL
jgi:hypothetical protein